LHQLFLLAREDGGRDPEAWTRFAVEALARDTAGSRVMPAGQRGPPDKSLVRREAEDFQQHHLPIYCALSMADPR
jgi:hypothetical protein